MKTQFKFLLVIIAVTGCFSFIVPSEIDPKNIVGNWEFVEMLDNNGKHVDTLRDNDGFMIPKEVDYNFRSDSTYSALFTEKNIDTGTWTYDSSNNQILLKLYWKKPYDEAAQYIITLGLSNVDGKGDYYDLIPMKLIELTVKRLVILDKGNRRVIYKKTH